MLSAYCCPRSIKTWLFFRHKQTWIYYKSMMCLFIRITKKKETFFARVEKKKKTQNVTQGGLYSESSEGKVWLASAVWIMYALRFETFIIVHYEIVQTLCTCDRNDKRTEAVDNNILIARRIKILYLYTNTGCPTGIFT